MQWATIDVLTSQFDAQASWTDADKLLLRQFADGLQAEYEAFIGRKILAADADDVVEFFDGGGKRVSMSVTPVIAVNELRVEDGAQRLFLDNTIVDASRYALIDDALYLTYELPPGKRRAKVTYTGGYESVPLDLLRVFLNNVRTEWKRRFDAGSGLRTLQAQGANVASYDKFGITPEAERVLRQRYYAKAAVSK